MGKRLRGYRNDWKSKRNQKTKKFIPNALPILMKKPGFLAIWPPPKTAPRAGAGGGAGAPPGGRGRARCVPAVVIVLGRFGRAGGPAGVRGAVLSAVVCGGWPLAGRGGALRVPVCVCGCLRCGLGVLGLFGGLFGAWGKRKTRSPLRGSGLGCSGWLWA